MLAAFSSFIASRLHTADHIVFPASLGILLPGNLCNIKMFSGAAGMYIMFVLYLVLRFRALFSAVHTAGRVLLYVGYPWSVRTYKLRVLTMIVLTNAHLHK